MLHVQPSAAYSRNCQCPPDVPGVPAWQGPSLKNTRNLQFTYSVGLAGALHLMLSEAKIDFDVCTERRAIDLMWHEVGRDESDTNSSCETVSAGH